MSARKNLEFGEFPHDPKIVDKLAWFSDVRFTVPYEDFPDYFPTARFDDDLLRDASTGVRLAETSYIADSGLVVARFILDAESREDALRQAVCVSIAALLSIKRIDLTQTSFERYDLGYMFDRREFGIEPASVLRELPPVLEDETFHHSLAA